ncbi:hypothetical protein [Marivirga sp.]|uniref:hypothetical protein n=1 Tax=Marivirga sp. TaxID=2018662 RepID=UPI002D7F6875|nr:hypothetical protein [Marivirga sp.]HET8859443.1 hypothetical protein [Marivirga sp.]
MKSNKEYIFQTYNFYRLWTWTKRVCAILLIIASIYLVDNPDFTLTIKTVIAFLLSGLIIIQRKHDLAVDENNLYLFKTSIVKRLTKIDKYPISEIKSIRASGWHSDRWEIIDTFNGGANSGGNYTDVEIDFINRTSFSESLSIHRKDINRMIKLVDRLKNKPNRGTVFKSK